MWLEKTGRGKYEGICTSVVFTIVRDHKHHFPLENVVLHQPAADAGYVFVRLHLLELPA